MHLGKEIQQLLHSQGRSVVWFSQAIKRSRQACHSMFKRPTIDTDLLKTISEVLGHDFFKDLSAEVELKK